MSAARLSLRARLLLAFVAIAVGVLVLSVVATQALVRRAIEQSALDDMRRRSDALISSLPALDVDVVRDNPATTERNEFRQSLERIETVMSLSDVSVVVLDESGRMTRFRDPALRDLFSLPDELRPDDIEPARVLAGDEVTGRTGDVVFLARVLEPNPVGTSVVVATDAIDMSVLDRARPWLILAALAALPVAAAVSAWLARRLTRPIHEIQATAATLATGDLRARASVPRGTDHELVALAETLNRMAARLDEARGSERAFLLSVSHDLRTPLTSIRGYAEALGDGTIDGADAEARARAASVIAAEARRLERLVRDLLDLSRLDTHQFSLTPRPVDAAAVVREAAEAFRPGARDLGIALHVGADEPRHADVDPERLAQIVANLVENALKYARSAVVVETMLADGRFEVLVTDDGPGIPDADLPRVFERLYTARTTPGRSVGTGLGLAIVRELAAAMGGSARAEQPSTGGSRFVVNLPFGAIAAASLQE